MNRRSFIQSAVCGFLCLIGVRKTTAEPHEEPLRWLRQRIVESNWDGLPPEYSSDGCVLMTDKRTYRICVKSDYVGCIMSNRYPHAGETWTRGRDLADGKRTIATWHRIVEDLKRVENDQG